MPNLDRYLVRHPNRNILDLENSFSDLCCLQSLCCLAASFWSFFSILEQFTKPESDPVFSLGQTEPPSQSPPLCMWMQWFICATGITASVSSGMGFAATWYRSTRLLNLHLLFQSTLLASLAIAVVALLLQSLHHQAPGIQRFADSLVLSMHITNPIHLGAPLASPLDAAPAPAAAAVTKLHLDTDTSQPSPWLSTLNIMRLVGVSELLLHATTLFSGFVLQRAYVQEEEEARIEEEMARDAESGEGGLRQPLLSETGAVTQDQPATELSHTHGPQPLLYDSRGREQDGGRGQGSLNMQAQLSQRAGLMAAGAQEAGSSGLSAPLLTPSPSSEREGRQPGLAAGDEAGGRQRACTFM